MKLLSFVLFFAVVYEIHSAATRLCGKNLAEVLDIVCENGFNGMQLSKKSINKPLQGNLDVMTMLHDIKDDSAIFKGDSLFLDTFFGERSNTLAKTRRQRTLPGVYDECCRKGCTITELSGYCI